MTEFYSPSSAWTSLISQNQMDWSSLTCLGFPGYSPSWWHWLQLEHGWYGKIEISMNERWTHYLRVEVVRTLQASGFSGGWEPNTPQGNRISIIALFNYKNITNPIINLTMMLWPKDEVVSSDYKIYIVLGSESFFQMIYEGSISQPRAQESLLQT